MYLHCNIHGERRIIFCFHQNALILSPDPAGMGPQTVQREGTKDAIRGIDTDLFLQTRNASRPSQLLLAGPPTAVIPTREPQFVAYLLDLVPRTLFLSAV